jgi:HEPN domain-containing protein
VAIGFHCQQACEKYLKAVLVRHQFNFPKTHDLVLLTKLVASADPTLARVLPPVDSLNVYGVEARYPSDLPQPSRWAIQADFEAVREIRAKVLAALRDVLADG